MTHGVDTRFLVLNLPLSVVAGPVRRIGAHTLHRDYRDAAEELYEKLPLLGSLMRWLKRRARS